MVIIAREVAVTILRTIAAERGLVIAASWLGKAKTVLQIAAVIALIATNPAPVWVDVLVYVALVGDRPQRRRLLLRPAQADRGSSSASGRRGRGGAAGSAIDGSRPLGDGASEPRANRLKARAPS